MTPTAPIADEMASTALQFMTISNMPSNYSSCVRAENNIPNGALYRERPLWVAARHCNITRTAVSRMQSSLSRIKFSESDSERLLFSIAAVQIAKKSAKPLAANGHKRTLTAVNAAICQAPFETCCRIASCIASFSDLNTSISPNTCAPLAPTSDKSFKNSTSVAPSEMGAISVVQCMSKGGGQSKLERSVGRSLTYLEKCLCRSLWAIA